MSLSGERSPLEPGYRLDRYELLCPIAHGGMASVWLARLHGKHGFEKLVAVKSILPEFASDVRFQKMFLDEARIASGIEHANVAQILDLGESHDVLYLVMEWVDGDSLSKLHRAVEKRGQRMPLGVVLRVLADTCGGLHAAHELRDKTGNLLNVVHRDVSPQNILVSANGTAKLIDFGIAKARDRVGGDTSTGFLKGKIQYMAPEQAVGRPIDRRADVWAVGAVLYYLVSGVPPYDGPNQLATLHMLTSGEPPPPLPDDFPPEVNELCLAAMAHDPDKRIATAADLQRRLERLLMKLGEHTTTHDVADFVAEHLADRTAARRNAVELALQAAAERARVSKTLQGAVATSDSASGVDGGTAAHVVNVGPNGDPIRTTPASGGMAHASNVPVANGGPGDTVRTSAIPADFGMPGAPGDPERDSQVSNATLGSAAVAYPPVGTSDVGKKHLWAVAAGVLGAAVIVAAIALVSLIVKRAKGTDDDAASAAAPTVTAIAPATTDVAPPPPPPAPPPTVDELDTTAAGPATVATTTTPPKPAPVVAAPRPVASAPPAAAAAPRATSGTATSSGGTKTTTHPAATSSGRNPRDYGF